MRVSVSADELTGVAGLLVAELQRRGHEPLAHGALLAAERDDWAWASEASEDRANVAHLREIERSQG